MLMMEIELESGIGRVHLTGNHGKQEILLVVALTWTMEQWSFIGN